MKRKFTEKQMHILDVAEKLIAKKGFDGTSVRDISNQAKINVAMISYYFGSKEKMMAYLYRYRIQKTRESFAEFAEIIRDGKPEMQMKELVKYVVSQLFKFNYFHGFVTQEMRHDDSLKQDMMEFYTTFATKMEEVIKKGISSGVFTNAPKPEDLLSTIIGTSLFAIRNKNFFSLYVPGKDENYLEEAEKKVLTNLLVTVFSVLGFQPH
ncbi:MULTISPECIES: TetR family transcriptional regulator [Chryseobacterium]|uniref:TetR family transcriptional regulator n=1 Tax=Chryseobacterium sp. R2A-55 TaxID=2744445 RepID=UPI001F184D62|nr:TetR family transcriptional regulator [Chryseobacterium sp. R2A-55]